MPELEAKITQIKTKLASMENGVMKTQYQSILAELEKELHRGAKINVIVTEQACDGCA